MADVNSILGEQLAEAHAQGDRPRQIALAVALLKERGADTVHLQRLIAKAAAELIAIHEDQDLEAAAGWAHTWHRHTRQPSAKALWVELQERVAAVRACELRLRAALDGRDQALVRTALAELESAPGRLATTPALIDEGRSAVARSQTAVRRKLTDRLARSEVLRRRLMDCLPGAFDQAMALLPELHEVDPSSVDDPQLEDLPTRFAMAESLHVALEAALAEPSVPALEQALSALSSSTDQLSTSVALCERAVGELAERRLRLDAERQACAQVDRSRLDLTLAAIEALVQSDPDAPEAAELPALRAEHARMLTLTHQLELGLEYPTRPGLTAAIAAMRTASTQLEGSLELADAVEEAIASTVRQRLRLRLLIAAGALAAAAVLVLLLTAWWRDSAAHAEVLAATDDERSQELASRYADDHTHLFYTVEMRARAEALANTIDDREYAAASAAGDPATRRAALDHYLARPAPRHRTEASTGRDAAQLELEDRAFEVANRITDQAQRIKALDAVVLASQVPERAARARAQATEERRTRNEAAWSVVRTAANSVVQIASINAYLALDGELPHAEEGVRLRTACEAVLRRQKDELADEAAWAAANRGADSVTQLANLAGYLAGSTLKRHAEAATTRMAQLRQQLDDTAFHAASAAPDPLQRADQLAKYLAGDTSHTHQADALTLLADAQWAAANAPGPTAEHLARIRAYLAAANTSPHRADALKSERDLVVAGDRELWDKARLLSDYGERIRAVDAYLTTPGEHLFAAEAKEELTHCMHWLPTLTPASLARLPSRVILALTPEQLGTLPSAGLAALPASVQARIAVHPPWSSSAGIDELGRWAELTLGTQPVRVRFIFPGQQRVASSSGGSITVAVAHGFWLAEQECTQALWVQAVGGFFSKHNPSANEGVELPVDSVTLGECREFIGASNRLLVEHKTPARIRLPTPAEWLFAASTASEGLAGADRGASRPYTQAERAKLAWSLDTSMGQTRPAAAGARDRWGLLNLLGNVAEWCSDADGSAQLHGGAWNMPLSACQPDHTLATAADARVSSAGLRLVVEDEHR